MWGRQTRMGWDNPATPQGIYLMWGRQTRMGWGQPSYAAGYLFNVAGLSPPHPRLPAPH